MSKRKEFHVARELRVRLSETGDWLGSVSRSSGEFFLAGELLFLLQEVQKSKSAGEGLQTRLRRSLDSLARGCPDAVELDALVEDLHGAGLLVASGARASKGTLLSDGFGDPWIQWAMLADETRCKAYEQALGRAVNAASVVVDVGAGTGLLGAMALHAGARKVYAIEETAAARGIAPLLKSLGLPSAKPGFELFQGNSSEAPLPSGASLVVSELFGNDPFCEGVLPTLRDVGSRLGAGPGTGQSAGKVTWVPEALEVFVEVCVLRGSPVHERVKRLAVARLAEPTVAPGDFHARFLAAIVAGKAIDPLSFAVFLQPQDIVRHGSPCSLGTLRLDPPSSPVVSYSGEKTLALGPEQGKGTGEDPLVALVWFRVRLDARASLSNHPLEGDACGHWSPIVMPLAPFASKALTVRFALAPFEDHLHVELLDTQGNRVGAR